MRVMWRIVKNTEAITLRGTYLLPNRQTGATLSIDSLYGVPEGTRATCFWWKPSDNRPLFGLVCSLLKTWRETNFFCVPSGPPYENTKTRSGGRLASVRRSRCSDGIQTKTYAVFSVLVGTFCVCETTQSCRTLQFSTFPHLTLCFLILVEELPTKNTILCLTSSTSSYPFSLFFMLLLLWGKKTQRKSSAH